MLNKHVLKLTAILLALSMIFSTSSVFAEDTEQTNYRYIVKFKTKTGKDIYKNNKLNSKKIKKNLENINALVIEIPKEETISLIQSDDVSYIEPDFTAEILSIDKPVKIDNKDIEKKKNNQEIPWGVKNIGADQTLKTYDGINVNVAIFDTGASTHIDLNINGGVSFVDYTKKYTDDNGQGTHIAGIITAKNNKFGIVGVAPRANIYAVKVLDEKGVGDYSAIIAGIEWSIKNNIDVINMSLGGNYNSKALEESIQQATDAGIIIVAAAGNKGTGTDTLTYPAKYAEVISVGAVNENNQTTDFSSCGSDLDIVAPGTLILSATNDSKYAVMSGTSVAAPHVTGSIAALKSKNRKLSSSEITNQILHNATTLGDANSYGNGKLNFANVVKESVNENKNKSIDSKISTYTKTINKNLDISMKDNIGHWPNNTHKANFMNEYWSVFFSPNSINDTWLDEDSISLEFTNHIGYYKYENNVFELRFDTETYYELVCAKIEAYNYTQDRYSDLKINFSQTDHLRFVNQNFANTMIGMDSAPFPDGVEVLSYSPSSAIYQNSEPGHDNFTPIGNFKPITESEINEKYITKYVDYAVYYNGVQINELYPLIFTEKDKTPNNDLYINEKSYTLFDAINTYAMIRNDLFPENLETRIYGSIEAMSKTYLDSNQDNWISYNDFINEYGFYKDSVKEGKNLIDYYFSPDKKYHVSLKAPEYRIGLNICRFNESRHESIEYQYSSYLLDSVGKGDNFFVKISDIEKHFKKVNNESINKIEKNKLNVGDLYEIENNPIVFPNRKHIEKLYSPYGKDYSINVFSKMMYNGEVKKDVPYQQNSFLLKTFIENLDISYSQNDSEKYVLLYSYDYIKENNWIDLKTLNNDITNKNAKLKDKNKIKTFEYDSYKKQFKNTSSENKSVFLDVAVFEDRAFISKDSVNDFIKKNYNITLYNK